MVLVQEDVEHGMGGEGGEFPDGIHPGYGLPSLFECVCPGPQALLIPLLGPGMPPQRPPEGTIQVTQEAQADPPHDP